MKSRNVTHLRSNPYRTPYCFGKNCDAIATPTNVAKCILGSLTSCRLRNRQHKMKKALARLLAQDVSLLREAFPALSFAIINKLSRLVKWRTRSQAHAGRVFQPLGKPKCMRGSTCVQDANKASKLSRHQPFRPNSRIRSCITTARL